MAAISWTGPVAVRPRGKHRLTLKQRLIRWNERTAEELRRAQPKRQAGKTARNAAAWTPVLPAVNWLVDPGMHVRALLAAAFIWAGAAIIGGLW